MTDRTRTGFASYLPNILNAILSLAFLIPLAGYLITATAFRLNGDDYCYLSVLNTNGFWKTQSISYLYGMPYSGDRYSATFISDVINGFRPDQYGLITVSLLLIWVLSLYWTFRNLSKLSRWFTIHWLTCLWLSEAVVVFTLYQAPNITQSVYWRAGQVAYLIPVVGICLDIGLILSLINGQKNKTLGLILVFVLTILVGGVSETGAAVQTLVCGLAFFGILWVERGVIIKLGPLTTGIALLGSLVAMALLILSPANQSRLKIVKTIPGIWDLISISLKYTFDFIYGSIRGQPLPMLISVIIAMLTVMIFFSSAMSAETINFKRLSITAVISILIMFVIIAACIAPSVYGESGYPESRVLIIARWFMVIETFFLGLLLGGIGYNLVSHSKLNNLLYPGTILFLLMLTLYPIYLSKGIYEQIPNRQSLASAWDLRDKEIRNQKANGLVAIKVNALDHMVQGVAELSADPTNWYNNCAAGFYGVQTITAK